MAHFVLTQRGCTSFAKRAEGVALAGLCGSRSQGDVGCGGGLPKYSRLQLIISFAGLPIGRREGNITKQFPGGPLELEGSSTKGEIDLRSGPF